MFRTADAGEPRPLLLAWGRGTLVVVLEARPRYRFAPLAIGRAVGDGATAWWPKESRPRECWIHGQGGVCFPRRKGTRSPDAGDPFVAEGVARCRPAGLIPTRRKESRRCFAVLAIGTRWFRRRARNRHESLCWRGTGHPRGATPRCNDGRARPDARRVVARPPCSDGGHPIAAARLGLIQG
jgi:hypothetical protein